MADGYDPDAVEAGSDPGGPGATWTLGYAVEVDTVFVFPFDVAERFRTSLTTWLLREPAKNNQHQRFGATPYKNAFHLLGR